ncbi:fructoselysine-6-P-deglycase FrlB-like protein [Asanoa ferruginea]|uniref:Fructoselysine-6-P-deglycase FrlB-like protein n=1 Tax=Asanoa ferruginea TaxID=53367 RepID=A0A3D9ZS63_9ACTN|nr:SIS domain-containing protein [Asanoa ferruginea]REF99729.1 fructoselysine-6-P-deglycase FrlB-like protein [Asanoa ferruginea]
MSTTADEIATQPELWRRAQRVLHEVADLLPAPGQDVCIVGCGTSLYMAQAAASLRESAGHGRTDAFAASEMPHGRRYDVIVAISRSGTTSEVTNVLSRGHGARSVLITAVPDGPVAAVADGVIALPFADERSVVQTRFATTALTLLRAHAGDGDERAATDAEQALNTRLPVDPSAVSQWTFLGRGWTVGLAQEAGLKLREAAQAWTEAYPALEYRHGPISVSGPGSVVWSFGPLDAALAREVHAVGATVVDLPLDPLASLVVAQRVAVELAEARGLNPDTPRNLTRSVVLSGDALTVL